MILKRNEKKNNATSVYWLVLNVQNKQYRRNFGKGFVQTPTFIMHAAILDYFTEIAYISGNMYAQ